jgi:Predicted membrane protein (DUF2079)
MSGTLDVSTHPSSTAPDLRRLARSPRRSWDGRSAERLTMLAIWLVGALAIAFATRGIAKWYVMTDELSYLKQAVFIAHHLRLPLAGDPFYNSHSDLLPLLGAPFVALLPTVAALKAFHVAAAVLMASTAIPVHLLARRVTRSPALAALAAALAISVPWVAMSAGFMSEIVAYPLAAWAFLAIHDACVRPGPRRDAIALLAIALACFARAQLLVLLAVLLACVAVHGLATATGGGRTRMLVVLRAHRLLAMVAALAVGVGVLALAVPSIASALLGNYGVTASTTGLIPPGIGRQTRFQLGTSILAIGVVPFAVGLAFALAAIADRRDRTVQASAVLILVGGAVLLAQAGWFTDRYRSYDDRYLLYLAPLMIVGFVAGLQRPWRLRWTAPPAAALTWYALAGVAIVPVPGLYLNSISTTSYAAIHRLAADVGSAQPATPLALLAAAALAVTVALGALRRRWLAPVVVGLPCLAVSVLALANVFEHERRDWRATAAAQGSGRDWIDRAVGRRAHVAALLGVPAGAADPVAVWWDTSYWNQALDHDYAVLPRRVDLLQNYDTPLRVDPADGRIENLRERFVVLPRGFVGFGIRGARVLRERDGLQLLRVPRDPRLAWRLGGVGAYGDLPRRDAAALTVHRMPTARRCLATMKLGMAPGAVSPAAALVGGATARKRVRLTPGGRPLFASAGIRVPAGRSARLSLRAQTAASAQPSAGARLLALAVTCRSR